MEATWPHGKCLKGALLPYQTKPNPNPPLQVEQPLRNKKCVWQKLLSKQRKRAVVACFRMAPLYNLPRSVSYAPAATPSHNVKTWVLTWTFLKLKKKKKKSSKTLQTLT